MDTRKSHLENFSFILPALIFFCVFSVYPLLKTFQLSVYTWDGIAPVMKFVGLAHYKHIFLNNPVFWKSMGNAGIITLMALTLQNAVALLLALIINKNIRGRHIFRAIFFLPPILSGIVVGLIWKWIYDGNYGILNYWLSRLGISGQYANWAWLSEIKTALISVGIVHIWKGLGYAFILFLAGLQSIPEDVYEAARIDGADEWAQFKHITAPLLVPVFAIVSILTILGTMQIFDLIYSMTRGGPAGHTSVPITEIYEYMSNGEFGYATTMAIVFGLVLFIVSIAQIRIAKKMKQV